MNTRENLILKDGEDVTSDVVFCKYNKGSKRYDVTFRGKAPYSCSYLSIEWIRKPERYNPELVHIIHSGRELFNIQDIYIFHGKADDYWRVFFSGGSERTYACFILGKQTAS